MLTTRNRSALAPSGFVRDPFALLRQMTSDFDRMFGESVWPAIDSSALRTRELGESLAWIPQIDMFERQNRLVTRVDLPGMRKEDVKVEVTDGHLAISGERKRESEEKQERFYRSERDYGSFYRTIPLPEGVKIADVKATFAEGVLEVSVPLPARLEEKPRRVEIQDVPKAVKSAA